VHENKLKDIECKVNQLKSTEKNEIEKQNLEISQSKKNLELATESFNKLTIAKEAKNVTFTKE